MSRETEATREQPTREQLYQWWWLHDGAWYQEVAKRFGFDAANEINKQALRFMAARVSRQIAGELDKPVEEMAWPEVVETFCKGAKLMWPEPSLKFDYAVTGPGTFEVNIRYNFALDMLRRAGTLEHYDCPCLALREGWFEGLGIEPAENRNTQCVRTGGDACSFVGRVAAFEGEP